MKQVSVEKANFAECLEEARNGRLVVTSKGRPVALLVRIDDLDEEQIELGSSDKFWKLVSKWRAQKTMSRAELERRLSGRTRSNKRF